MDEQLVEELPREPIEPKRPAKRDELENWLYLAGIYAVFMLGNVSLPTVFWQMNGRFWMESTAFFLDGTLAAELGILGVWMGLSDVRWLHRLLGCGVLLGMSATSYLLGLQFADAGDLPVEAALMIYGIALGSWIGTWFVLAIIRSSFGWHIGSVRARSSVEADKQVSIRYLFVATTSMAVLTAMVKAAMPSTSAGNGSLPAFAFAAGIYVVYSLCLLIPCCWIGLKRPVPYRLIPVLMLEIYFLGQLTMQCLAWCLKGTFNWELTAYFFIYSCGFVISALAAFAVLRRGGFELRTASRSN